MNDQQATGRKPLQERVEGVRRRWSENGITSDDEGIEYIFARGDIRILLEAIDALTPPQPMPDSVRAALMRQLFTSPPPMMDGSDVATRRKDTETIRLWMTNREG